MLRSRNTRYGLLRICGTTGLAIALLRPGAVNAENDAYGPNLKTLCSAWMLTQKGLAAVDELISVAKDGIETSAKFLEECKAKPLCAYSRERQMLEKSLADARSQQARAEALSASMQERQNHIRGQLERLRGPAGVKACSET
jgi:hypothetical protein